MGEKVKCLACNGSGEIEIPPTPPTTKLRHLRIARGLSLRKAARGLRVSPTTLGKWEKEKEPNISLKYMRKLAAFYDTNFSTLFCDDVSDPETEANARLIAAAQLLNETPLAVPDLFAALKLTKRMIDEALPKFDWGKSALDADAINAALSAVHSGKEG